MNSGAINGSFTSTTQIKSTTQKDLTSTEQKTHQTSLTKIKNLEKKESFSFFGLLGKVVKLLLLPITFPISLITALFKSLFPCKKKPIKSEPLEEKIPEELKPNDELEKVPEQKFVEEEEEGQSCPLEEVEEDIDACKREMNLTPPDQEISEEEVSQEFLDDEIPFKSPVFDPGLAIDIAPEGENTNSVVYHKDLPTSPLLDPSFYDPPSGEVTPVTPQVKPRKFPRAFSSPFLTPIPSNKIESPFTPHTFPVTPFIPVKPANHLTFPITPTPVSSPSHSPINVPLTKPRHVKAKKSIDNPNNATPRGILAKIDLFYESLNNNWFEKKKNTEDEHTLTETSRQIYMHMQRTKDIITPSGFLCTTSDLAHESKENYQLKKQTNLAEGEKQANLFISSLKEDRQTEEALFTSIKKSAAIEDQLLPGFFFDPYIGKPESSGHITFDLARDFKLNQLFNYMEEEFLTFNYTKKQKVTRIALFLEDLFCKRQYITVGSHKIEPNALIGNLLKDGVSIPYLRAIATKVLCDHLNIECALLTTGNTGAENSYHSWNIINIDDALYLFDSENFCLFPVLDIPGKEQAKMKLIEFYGLNVLIERELQRSTAVKFHSFEDGMA